MFLPDVFISLSFLNYIFFKQNKSKHFKVNEGKKTMRVAMTLLHIQPMEHLSAVAHLFQHDHLLQ